MCLVQLNCAGRSVYWTIVEYGRRHEYNPELFRNPHSWRRREIQEIAMAMCLTLHPQYQRLKTNRRRKQQRRNQHHDATRTDSSGDTPDDQQPDASRSLSAGQMAMRTEIGDSSSRSMPPKRTVCYQQQKWQPVHLLGKKLPCTFWGNVEMKR